MIWQWITPEGIKIVESINIDSASINHAGQYTYSVVDYFGCADSVTRAIQVNPLPTANFPTNNGIIPYEQTYLLEATQGYASYEWNTGDTIYFVTVTTEGDYTVTMKTAEGCEAIESVYMLETFIPIQVPNAFTPNGDGLNDTFKPVVNAELVHRFNMTIYNKWGQRIFETTNATEGWDGKDVLPGVYNWVISYSNVVGKVFQLKGSVMVVK
jgi:gliding motility-associated-like protein